jgi:DNA-binding MarR family transcriptional regulator
MLSRVLVGGTVTSDQELLSATAKTVFRLNGQLLTIGEALSRPVGLTAAWWQVLAAVLDEPLSVADVARSVGVTRQSVQRIADLLVESGLAQYQPNPAHRRAKLLSPTPEGRDAVRRIAPAHAELAEKLVDKIGHDQLAQILDGLEQLSAGLDALASTTQLHQTKRSRA